MAAHARIPPFPFAASLQGAHLDGFHEDWNTGQHDLVLDYQELRPAVPPGLFEHSGIIHERIQGIHIPRRLRFSGLESFEALGAFQDPEGMSLDHPGRMIHALFCFIPRGQEHPLYVLFNNSIDEDGLLFSARSVMAEERTGPPAEVTMERDWSPAPPPLAGIIPSPLKFYERFGGDPVRIRLGLKSHSRRLFIGAIESQPRIRPSVSSVLNVGEEPSRWVDEGSLPASDRWACKGEGHQSMGSEEICSEARWVIDRLNRGERVLVHCVGGMNRSSTICCAVLILMEGLSAERALQRVREHHPWAMPDSHHWLKLRWLALSN